MLVEMNTVHQDIYASCFSAFFTILIFSRTKQKVEAREKSLMNGMLNQGPECASRSLYDFNGLHVLMYIVIEL